MAHEKLAFYDNMSSCLNKMMEQMKNQTKQQDNALMMQHLDHQIQFEKASSLLSLEIVIEFIIENIYFTTKF